MIVLLKRTWVPGTPRGFGDKKTENEWLQAMVSVLGSKGQGLIDGRYEIELEFLLDIESPNYRDQNRPHGTDLDNLVKLTIDGLTPLRGRGTGMIKDDKSVFRIVASKELVDRKDPTVGREDLTGAWITIRLL